MKSNAVIFVFVGAVFFSACTTQPTRAIAAESAAASGEVEAPNLICNVMDFGAKGDGVTLDTDAIKRAINACKNKYGTVLFPANRVFMSAMIELGSQMTLRLEAGAVLKGVRDGDASYPTLQPSTNNDQLLNCRKALVFADGATDLTIEGPGAIDGNGDWVAWKKDAQKIDIKEAKRPMAIFIVRGTNLVIRNLNVKDAAMWAVVLMETVHTRVDHLNVDSHTGQTRDGIDLVDGDDIIVENSSIFTGDDSFCLKSGVPSGLKNVIIRNSEVRTSYTNGLKFGTASIGVVDNILFENITINHVNKAAMTIESIDGSQIKNVTFRNIKVNDVGSVFFVLAGSRVNKDRNPPGKIENITFENISEVEGQQKGTRSPWGSAISGTILNGKLYGISEITFKNVHVSVKGSNDHASGKIPKTPPEYAGQYPDPDLWGDLPAFGLYFRHVNGVHLNDVYFAQLNGADKRRSMTPHDGKTDFDIP